MGGGEARSARFLILVLFERLVGLPVGVPLGNEVNVLLRQQASSATAGRWAIGCSPRGRWGACCRAHGADAGGVLRYSLEALPASPRLCSCP